MRTKMQNVTRINFNISNELLAKVDEYARVNGINRTAALSCVVSTYFRQEEAMSNIKAVSELTELLGGSKKRK